MKDNITGDFYLHNIHRPTLIVDEQISRRNIERMADKARRSHLSFCPHFKTHQSAVIGNWFRDYGVSAITVSSIRMGQYFASHLWDDITVAFPVNLRETEEINNLSKKIRLNLLVEHPDPVKLLEKKLKQETGLFIEIDTGYHRSGIVWNHTEQIDQMISLLKKSTVLQFKGFLSHTGETYSAGSKEEILQFHHSAVARMNSLKQRYASLFPAMVISLGDTPSFSLLDNVSDIDEMRPGNFVFYDLMQERLGACAYDNIAVSLACPVVARYPERSELVIYGGAIHFSKEFLRVNGQKIYGLAVEHTSNGWRPLQPLAPLISLSQEHGIVHMDKTQQERIRRGDILCFFPIHSCLTANLMRGYVTTKGITLDHLEGTK